MANKITNKEAITNTRLWKLMTDKNITSPKELARQLLAAGLLTAKKTAKNDSKDPNLVESNRKRISYILKNPDAMTFKEIDMFCQFFDCSADYLLGYIDTKKHSIETVHNVTGLSENAISALVRMKTAKEKSPAAGMFNELDTLDFILSDMFKDMKKTDSSKVYNIFHSIALYLHSDCLEKTPINRARYRSGNKFFDLKPGDIVNDNEVQDIDIYYDSTVNKPANDPDKIFVNDKSANDQPYSINWKDLMQTHAKDNVFRSLDQLKEAYNKKRG